MMGWIQRWFRPQRQPQPQPAGGDIARRDELLDHLAALGLRLDSSGAYFRGGASADEPGYAVSLDQFFNGNGMPDGSIASNLPEHPGKDGFEAALRSLDRRPDVQGMFVGITSIEDEGADNPHWWPYSDTVFIVTRTPQAEVARLFAPIAPDDVAELSRTALPAGLPVPNEGFGIIQVWWD
jgi:hypothetical protein